MRLITSVSVEIIGIYVHKILLFHSFEISGEGYLHCRYIFFSLIHSTCFYFMHVNTEMTGRVNERIPSMKQVYDRKPNYLVEMFSKKSF